MLGTGSVSRSLGPLHHTIQWLDVCSTFSFSHPRLYIGSHSATASNDCRALHRGGKSQWSLYPDETRQCIKQLCWAPYSSVLGTIHHTPPLWKSQGSLKAALRHPPVNASYCDLKVCDTSASAPITALTLHLATCKNDASFVMRT